MHGQAAGWSMAESQPGPSGASRPKNCGGEHPVTFCTSPGTDRERIIHLRNNKIDKIVYLSSSLELVRIDRYQVLEWSWITWRSAIGSSLWGRPEDGGTQKRFRQFCFFKTNCPVSSADIATSVSWSAGATTTCCDKKEKLRTTIRQALAMHLNRIYVDVRDHWLRSRSQSKSESESEERNTIPRLDDVWSSPRLL